ncbi:MAG: glutamate--tRNA ligase [Candidatus Velthaea sp.]
MDSAPVRTRVAPSPTGDPHVGTAYVALVNYAFAKQHGGQFLLRIEDTDQARSTRESEAAILASLRWLGLSWDEGPDVGGPHGPYRQSDRSEIYAHHAAQLLAAGKAFRCFCTPQRLDEMREAQKIAKQPPRYDGHCLALSATVSQQRATAGELFTVRLKVPDHGKVSVNDLRRGPIEFEWSTVDMQVLMKSDGLPTYHLANVVDDHLMQITHVIRGEEWVSSAPKHLLLYDYFGWAPPAFMHLPLLRNPDKSKLSKRKNPTSILFYERMGYLPEALLNFLGLLFAGSVEGHEVMSLPELVERIDLQKISLGGPVFDVPKLDWLNGQYLRAITPAQLVERTQSWGFDRDRIAKIVELAHARIERLSDLGLLTAFFFAGRLPVTKDQFADGKLDLDTARRALALAMWQFDEERAFDKTTVERVLKALGEKLEVKFRDLARVYYIAMTGSPTSVPLFDAMAVLGRDICRERFRVAIDVLGGVSAAEKKAWVTDAARVLEPA